VFLFGNGEGGMLGMGGGGGGGGTNKNVSPVIINGPESVKCAAEWGTYYQGAPVLLNCASHFEDVGGVKVKNSSYS